MIDLFSRRYFPHHSFCIFSKSQLAKEKTGEKLEKQITNGKIPKQLKEDEDKDGKEEEEEEEDKDTKKNKEDEEEEEEDSWEVLKSSENRIETNGMVKKIQ